MNTSRQRLAGRLQEALPSTVTGARRTLQDVVR